MYEIVFTSTALKQLQHLEKSVQGRIIIALERIRIRPEAHIKKLVGSLQYSLRVGDYRLILELQRNVLTILIVAVGHRRNIYK